MALVFNIFKNYLGEYYCAASSVRNLKQLSKHIK